MKRIIKIIIALLIIIVLCFIGMKLYVNHNKNAFQIPVLMYHDVLLDDHYKGEDDTISISMFKEQLQYLKDNNYKTLTLEEFYDYVVNNKKIPQKSVLLTFDDGFYSFHYLVEPLLEEYNMHAVCFVIGEATKASTPEYDPNKYGTIGKDLISNHSEYVEYGSHSYGLHKEVNGQKMIDTLSKEKLKEELNNVKEIADFKYMSYPFNTDTPEIRELLKEYNYKLAFRGEKEQVLRNVNQYQIPRIGTKSDFKEFKEIFESDYYKNRYGNGIIRKVMITIERKLGKRLF